jgi:hypothetical protein
VSRLSPKIAAIGTAVFIATWAILGQTRLPGEPGASPGVSLIDISKNSPAYSSAFPSLALNSRNDQEIAVAWRLYSLPIDTNAPRGSRTAECHVSISADGGKTFRDVNLMDALRTERVEGGAPELWYCNAPWVTFGSEETIYAGGSLFTANGVTGPEPKQGRAMVTVTTDGGATWKKAIPGIEIARFAPGVAGLGGGRDPQDTPWDGSAGMADPQTGTFYSAAGMYVSASADKASAFGTVYSPTSPGWVRQGGGSFAVSTGTLAVAGFVKSTPIAGTKCPCLSFAESTDRGAHWTFQLVGDAVDISTTGRPHYPPIAGDPARAGHFAIATTSADKQKLVVFSTQDNGKTWSSASPNLPPKGSVSIASVDMPGVGYTPTGDVVAAWRGFRAAGSYDVYVAMITAGKFGPTLKLSEEGSPYPPLVQLGNYSLGGGDFSTPVSGNKTHVFVAFPYSPGGIVQKTTLAKVPLGEMK